MVYKEINITVGGATTTANAASAQTSAVAAQAVIASTSAATNAQGENMATISLVAKNIAFDKRNITIPAGSKVTINFDNQDSGIPHSFAVYIDSSASKEIFKGEVITGPKTTTYTSTAPTTFGTYFFR